MAIPVGSKAPDFTLKSQQASGLVDVKLSDHFGKKNTVLLFFPAAFTGVCTKEMCEISAGLNGYSSLNADVIGISVDTPFSQGAWAKQEKITIPLASDLNKEVIRKYDVKGEAPHMVLLGPGGRMAYVSNTNTGTLAAVNLETGEARTLPTGARPQGTVMSRDKKTMYATNSEANTISKIDAGKFQVTGTIQTGKWPCRLALTPDEKSLVYALQNSEAVGFADLGTMKEVKQVPLGGKLVSLTLSSDGRYAYSSAQEQDKISVISLAERKVVRVIETPKGSGPDPVIALR